MLVLNFALINGRFRLWGRVGLVWVPISVIVANIQVTKNVSLFGLEATLGNIVYATGFLATDILSELYGKKDAYKAVSIGFFSLLAMTLLMQMALFFEPASSDIAQESLSTIFSLMPRIALASLTAYLASNLHDVWAFDYWKRRRPGRHTLWMRNNFSTFVSQLIDTVILSRLPSPGSIPGVCCSRLPSRPTCSSGSWPSSIPRSCTSPAPGTKGARSARSTPWWNQVMQRLDAGGGATVEGQGEALPLDKETVVVDEGAPIHILKIHRAGAQHRM